MRTKRARLLLALPAQAPFYRALHAKSDPSGAAAGVPRENSALVPLFKTRMYFKRNQLRRRLRSLANSPAWLARVTPRAVPALLRREAARGDGPKEYSEGGSLVERTFGIVPRADAPRIGETPLAWEQPQEHRKKYREEYSGAREIPIDPPRHLTSWQASVIVFCYAEYTATDVDLAPAAAYFFYRDLLADQVRVSTISTELRRAGRAIVQWFSGAPNEMLDECAQHVPPQPKPRADQVRISVVGARCSAAPIRSHETQPKTSDHRGRATATLRSGAYASMEFDRASASPEALYAALFAVARDSKSFNITFDETRVVLDIDHILWKRITINAIPHLMLRRAYGLEARRDRQKYARPIAPFLAIAYMHGSPEQQRDVVASFYSLLFSRCAVGSATLLLVPRIFRKYPDIVARMRSAYRHEIDPDTETFARGATGFFAALFALGLENADRLIDYSGHLLLHAGPLKDHMATQYQGSDPQAIARFPHMSPDDLEALYKRVDPETFEHIVSADNRREEISPRFRHALESGAAKEPVDPRPPRPETDAIDPFVRAIYEAERMSTVAIRHRGDRDAPRCEIALDWREVWEREIAPDVPAKMAFPVAIAPRFPSNALFYSAHADAEPCLVAQPVTLVRPLPQYGDDPEDMNANDLRASERGDDAFRRAMDARLDDRSEGSTRSYYSVWRELMPIALE